MEITNIILLISGIIVVLFGIGAFLNPNLARWINAPGTPIIKAVIAIAIGIILIIVGFVFQFTT
ncbi:hypothetical protein MBGDN05_00738 [Thermoplasmatales archaeon SCGC AB-539-N05]|nr:hypothetical protein MBGDN05_00738 [Thermoplasmatales archaeon SCGC AB-539-N05]